MHCRTCEYPLWNLATRTCPECGAPFMPSDFGFVPNSVRFCCPHCRTAYYGTAANGHLAPSRFTCVGCAQSISMNDCVLLPSEGVSEHETKPEVYPWFDPRRRWQFSGWFLMMGRSMVMPRRVGRMIPRSAPMGFCFGLLVSAACVSIALAHAAIPVMLARLVSSGGVQFLWAIVALLFLTLAHLAAIAVALALWIGVAHLVLRATGPASAGFARTGQAICYTAPILLPTALPCAGFWLIPVLLPWWTISAGAAIAGAHGVAPWRGMVAGVVTPLLLLVGAMVLAVIVM